jgi:glycerol uptake facilitator-like aquaporin
MKIKQLVFEFFGTATLLIGVVGSSFMATNLTADKGLALLINAAVTAATLGIIIKVGASVSGAHYNPAVTFANVLLRKNSLALALQYLLAQVVGAICGVILANAMFSSKLVANSTIERSGTGLVLAEIIATVGLVYLALTSNEKSAWKLIPLWIFAAYFFTSSTSFANPAVTLSRVFTESGAGINSGSVLWFVLAQIVGSLLATTLVKLEKNRG